jgi:hypothetical protein
LKLGHAISRVIVTGLVTIALLLNAAAPATAHDTSWCGHDSYQESFSSLLVFDHSYTDPDQHLHYINHYLWDSFWQAFIYQHTETNLCPFH